MRKFNEVIEDVKAPNTQSLWLNEGSLSYYGKNGWESIGGSGSSDKLKSSIKEITYSELKEMRDNDKLSPGALYRITDYICTTIQTDTTAARNQFDIIVLATSINSLSEQARAINHTPQEGDTDYFANSNLSAWQIWYCLDNDTTRFAWADTTNGKGVIYRMIDEWNNDVPYDFKNIKFKYFPNPDAYYFYYTFASDFTWSSKDISLNITTKCHNNTIRKYTSLGGSQILNEMLFIGDSIYSNYFMEDCHKICSDRSCYNNIFGMDCYNIQLGESCGHNSFGSDCYNIKLKFNSTNNSFGNYCNNISSENYFSMNSFGNGCGNISITVGSFYYNSFGNACKYIKLISTASGAQNYNFAHGLQGTSSTPLVINVESSKAYETKVAKNSSGTLKIYCEANLVQ